MSFTKVFLLFLSFVASVSALATPHVHRGLHHRALAGRVPVPAPVDLPSAPVRRRSNGKRCRPRSSSAVAVTSSPTPETTKAPATLLETTEAPSPPPETTKAPATLLETTEAPSPPPETTKAPPKTTHTPEPTITQKYTPTPKPSPASTKEEPPATTKKSSPPPSSNQPSFMVGTQSGQGTFYSTGLGACGITNKDSDYIAAVSHLLFDDYPGYGGANSNTNPICGRKVTASYKGKTVTVAITDRCEGCALDDLDFSPSAFQQLADPNLGRIDITWTWD